VEEVNAHLRELCKRENLQLLDFGKAFADQDGTRRPEYAAEDGSHISSAGYRALSVYAASKLRRTD
jgi:lysophospholipase L1-like esterase